MTTELSRETVPAEGTLVRALMSEVLVDYNWNARSRTDLERVIPKGGALGGYNAEAEATGMGQFRGTANEPGLIEQLVLQGQRSPCDARPVPKGKHKYELTAGFRRHYALAEIAKSNIKWGDEHPIIADPTWSAKKPTILLLVKQQTNAQARERNLSENTARTQLSTPDLAFGLADLARELKIETREEPTNEDLGRRISRSAGTVSNLRKVMRLPSVVTAHWRNGGEAMIAGQRVISLGPISLDAMCGLAGLPSGTDYESEYVKLVMGLRDEEGKPKDAAIRKFERALKRAAELARLVAFLGYEGIDPAKVSPAEWPKLVDRLDCDASAQQLVALVKRMTDTYEEELAALASPEDGADDEGDEEETTKKRGKRDGGR